MKNKNWFLKHLPTINKWIYLTIASMIMAYISHTFFKEFLYACGAVSVGIIEILLKQFNTLSFFQEDEDGKY